MIDGINYIPIICGPTASGKSSLAISLCERYNGELISCDSMQIYKYLDIGTAKATADEQNRVVHHMIDIINPGTDFSVNEYLDGCFGAIEDIMSRGKLPVICGGTGQYVSALYEGIKYIEEPVSEELVKELYQRFDKEGIDSMYEELVSVDPEAAAKIHPNNTRRVIRAYSVYKATGKKFSDWNKESKKSGSRYPFKLFELDYEDSRDVLYDRINKRVDIMMSEGLLQEAEYLYSLDIPRASTCFQAIGYKEFAPYFSGEYDLDRAVYEIKLNSRHYAKRQLTWFRYMKDIIKLDYSSSKSDLEEITFRNIL